MITTILWDVDGTLLDFDAAERAAIRALFAEFGLGVCTDAMLARYSAINVGFWQRLERGEMTRPQILVRRFEQFFGESGIDPRIAPAFNKKYQVRLGDTAVCRDDSLNVVKALRGKVKQYVVSNGTVVAQTRKLERAGLGAGMDGIFLSEALGAEKPGAAFFDRVFETVRPRALSEVLIVGDSLTGDIRGGMNAGIRTCWYNPGHLPRPDGYRIDHEIDDLHAVMRLLEAGDGGACGGYVCKVASPEEMDRKWDETVREHPGEANWVIWKAEAIREVRAGRSIPYYGILDGAIICEATAVPDPSGTGPWSSARSGP